jgi:biotin synthase
MMKTFQEILLQSDFNHNDLKSMLHAEGEEKQALFQAAKSAKHRFVGNKVYFRGLIEFSNVCGKDCFYCGIRKSNKNVHRYSVTDDEIIEACQFALKNRYGSIVLQSGELTSPDFIARVECLLRKIKNLSKDELGITLSCGEQTPETYRLWRAAGAHRYLLRIETSNPELYRKIHPDNQYHRFELRLQALQNLKSAGYQVGTGVMIGLPFQTMDDLANDLLFFKDMDIDMVGMGPYIEHEETPLFQFRDVLMPKNERFELALKMIACLRLLMPDINIAATTALQAIDSVGREKALSIGANILMPNLTPCSYRSDYQLYEGKPCLAEDAELCRNCLEARIDLAGCEIGYGEWGDSKHFGAKNS